MQHSSHATSPSPPHDRTSRPLPRELVTDQPLIHSGLGPCRVAGWREEVVAGRTERVLVIAFAAAGMTLSIPESKIEASPLRSLASPEELRLALAALSEPPEPPVGTWQRSMNQYVAKLREGSPEILATIVRDLRVGKGAWRSKIRDQALSRLSEELALVDRIPVAQALAKIEALLPALA